MACPYAFQPNRPAHVTIRSAGFCPAAARSAAGLESAKRVSAIVALDALFASSGLPEAMARFADDARDTDALADRQQGWRTALAGAG
jgi:hypothetical protein